MKNVKIFIKWLIYILFLCIVVIYSYSQIDLNLTLIQNKFYLDIQQKLIYLGYYNRRLSFIIFQILLTFSFILYIFILYRIKNDKETVKSISIKIIITIAILSLSYPAFSHDFFNYIFDARILTKYGLNPYSFKALDFPEDTWIRFMHWTHRTYPYGPVWIFITVPFSVMGFGKFITTYLSFKIMFGLMYLINSLLIYRLAEIINKKDRLLIVSYFAFNPLIIIESIVSPHNESAMLIFLLLSFIYFFKNSKTILPLIFMVLSGLVKFVTLILVIPIISFYLKFINKSLIFSFSTFLIFIMIIIEIYYREIYPWYFVVLYGLTAFYIKNRYIFVLTLLFSYVLLSRYSPFLYYGEYNMEVKFLQKQIITVTVFIGMILLIILKYTKNKFIIK
jgi:hypothetical protein